jgi:tetratricopeptide (TPR) repeat protein
MGVMPSAQSDLIIVSLVRYADSCEPNNRHSDCPFAVERQGRLTCHEECRGVIKSLLRRGRGEPSSRLQAFDARQLRLSEPPGAPDILWHTSSLLQVVVRAARTSPFRRDGSLELRRLVEATSALGALGSRGLDPEHIVRRGVAGSVKLALAVWLGRKPDGRLINWKYLAQWQAIFEKGTAGQDSAGGYFSAVLDGPVAQYLNAWIATASVEDVLTWRPPWVEIESIVTDPDKDGIETWVWVVDRFTQTYLDRWSLSSLKREYSFVQGSWHPDFSEVVLAERVVGREDVATALADRAMVSGDVIDPAMMQSFTEQALTLLRDGQRTAAAALFNAARMLKPQDRAAQNNYAFCILLDKPEEAKGLLMDVLERGGIDSAVPWCNLALVEWLLGHTDAALKACERAYEDISGVESHLWVRRDDDWAVKQIKPRAWAIYFGAELERSIGASSDIWAGRLESLTPLEQKATSSDPSSTGTDEEDL